MKKNLLLIIISLLSEALFAQINLKGNVVFINGTVANQVNIHISGSTLQTISDVQGNFNFHGLNSGNYSLTFSLLGYQTRTLSFNLQHDTSIITVLDPAIYQIQEVTINSTRVNANSGMSYSELDKSTLQTGNLGQDVPYLLQLLPSVVVSSDAGTGIGYTGIRIRGSDPSRINVSINDIPINDAESQNMYWVDLPDIVSSTENIQVQRGVGASANGTGSFGGSINLQSNNFTDSAFANSSNAFGTFNSFKNNISIGTGLLNQHWNFEGKLSRIISDGFVDRGKADLKSYSFSAGYKGKKILLRLNIFSGKEITYQSWNGIPESRYNDDSKEMQNYIDRNGSDSIDANNLLHSGITYNYFTYDNQVDDYKQDHYQFFISQNISNKWMAKIAFHYTHGSGFYEEFKKDQALADYNILSTDTSITTTDLIRRKWLDNDFYGTTFNFIGTISDKFTTTIGGGFNRYEGQHFGEVIWAKNAVNSTIRNRYYDDQANKNDFNIYNKSEIKFSTHFIAFIDLQLRMLNYTFEGLNDVGNAQIQNDKLSFFNPKFGLTYNLNDKQVVYGSIAIANKEPNRDDYVSSTEISRPNAESLTDFELGYKLAKSNFHFSANLYYMNYKDQLVLTGAVNDVGNYTRTNTPKSYRRGIELDASYSFNKRLSIDGNITISENKIKHFNEYLDSLDGSYNYGGQIVSIYNKTDIAFSPSIIYMGRISYNLIKNMTAQFIIKQVGSRYLDNTKNEARSLSSYNVCDIKLNYSLKNIVGKEIEINLLLNNIFSEKYASNGYTYGYKVENTRIDENFYYPQAKINFLGQITLRF